jgi:hypothetical protein
MKMRNLTENHSNLGNGNVRTHGVLGECAAAHEMEQLLAATRKSTRVVRHHPGTLRDSADVCFSCFANLIEPNLLTQIRLRRFAEFTFVTLRNVQRNDMVT